MSATELEPFLAYLQELDRDPATIALYRSHLNQFFAWFSETTGQEPTAANVTPLDIRHYREQLTGQRKPTTINRKLSVLRVFFTWCNSTGQISSNPTARLKPIKASARAPKWLDRKQTYAVLRMAQQAYQVATARKQSHRQIIAARTMAIVTLLLNTGLRVSELCALKTKDIQIKERSGLVIVRKGKGDKYREIPLNLDARRAITEWLTIRTDDNDYLFSNEGQPIDRRLINWHLERVGQAAGVHLTPHILRHTFGKNLVDAGEPLDRVAMLMGHSNINTTAIYTVPSLSDLNRAVEKIAWSD